MNAGSRRRGYQSIDALAALCGSEIALAARSAGRDPASVKLVAVTKTVPAPTIEEAIAAGQRRFGENRVQEAQGKMAGAAKSAIPASSCI